MHKTSRLAVAEGLTRIDPFPRPASGIDFIGLHRAAAAANRLQPDKCACASRGEKLPTRNAMSDTSLIRTRISRHIISYHAFNMRRRSGLGAVRDYTAYEMDTTAARRQYGKAASIWRTRPISIELLQAAVEEANDPFSSSNVDHHVKFCNRTPACCTRTHGTCIPICLQNSPPRGCL